MKSMFAEAQNQEDITAVPGENEVKPYRCKTCESCFSRYDHLKLHQARCRGKRRLEVRVVKMSLDSLNTSPQSKTQEGDPLQCTVCFKQLSTQSDLKRHMSMLHITNKPFPCKRCGKTYSSKKTLSRHNLNIRCKKISKESVPSATNNVQKQPCRETSKLLQRIQVHYMNKFKYQCEYCPRRFKLSGQLKVHLRLHTGEKPYGCANCGEHFIRTDYLKRHLVKCNGKGENVEKVLCDKCGDLFTRDALSIHQKTCVVSSKSPGSSKELQQHFLAKHRSDQPQESVDDQQQLISNHLPIIKQEPLDEEDGQSQESSSPIRERRACSNIDLSKPLKCPKCNMRFSRSTGLEWRNTKENGSNTTGTGVLQTKFSCKDQDQENDAEKGAAEKGDAEKGDAEKGNAEKGDAVHKYQCSECDQSFTDGLRLISHLEEHGREDQERKSDIHRCQLCSKVFAQAVVPLSVTIVRCGFGLLNP
ncbi:hypothetical protein F2P79_012549 [Pimephales promelas]|nr:hypothetical protein F2P79_012549 [Pimephales promelas]